MKILTKWLRAYLPDLPVSDAQLADDLTLRGIAGPNADRVIPCLHKFIGDTLMICYGLGGTRPAHFHTEAGAQLYLVTYRRKL